MKFFNKTRFEMVKGKRLYNYIIYAIGEIILVVIGILIALWINNWSKENQIKKTNRNLQEKVLAQLDTDIADLDDFRKDLDTLDNYYLRALNRDYDAKKIVDQKLIPKILFEVIDLGLSEQNMNSIENAVLDNSLASEELLYLSNRYKFHFKNIDDTEKIIYQKTTTNIEAIEATQPWYTELVTDFRCREDCYNYIFTDESNLARIASLRLLYKSNYAEIVKVFYSELQESRTELRTLYKASE